MDRTLKIAGAILAIVIIGAVLLFINPLAQQTPAPSYPGNVTVYFFYGEECPHCHAVMPFLSNLSGKYPQVDFRYLETWHHSENQTLAEAMNKNLGVTGAGVPEVVIGTNVLIGDRDIPVKLEALIQAELKKKQ